MKWIATAVLTATVGIGIWLAQPREAVCQSGCFDNTCVSSDNCAGDCVCFRQGPVGFGKCVLIN